MLNVSPASAKPVLSGTALALMAFASFPVGDAIVKSMGGEWPPSAVAALRFCFGAFVLGLFLYRFEGRSGFVVGRPWLHVGRGFALAFGTFTFFSAIYVMPLADAAAIQFINPVLTTLFSGWFLGERTPRSAWAATALAFTGVLVMLRPNVTAFGILALLPLVSAFGIAALIILNRKVSHQRSILAAQFFVAFWAAIFLSAAAIVGHYIFPALRVTSPPDWTVIVRCMIVAVTATCAHFLLYMATVRTSAASIAPLTYVQLLISTLFSIIFFGDRPDSIAIIGGLMIVAAGLWVIISQRRLASTLAA